MKTKERPKMLKKAVKRIAYAKLGIYGRAGSGKTYTSALIAIGLHKYAKLKKPIAMFDTEPSASFIIPLFEKAGVQFMVYDESRALVDLMAWLDEVEEDCSIGIIDSVTHVWRDAQDSYLNKLNAQRINKNKDPLLALQFEHWKPIKAEWAKFTDRYLSSKVHIILCGRLGDIYEYQQNEATGKKELITVGAKMATEKELGYEPSLLIEMAAERRDGEIVNIAYVEKDRAQVLNGKEIEKPDFAKLRPHFEALNLGGEHFGSMQNRDSQGLYRGNLEEGWSGESKQREIWSEEIQGLLVKHFPTQAAEDKKKKLDLMEQVFKTRSWTKVESTNSEALKAGYKTMKAILEPEPILEEAEFEEPTLNQEKLHLLDIHAGHPQVNRVHECKTMNELMDISIMLKETPAESA